MNPIVKNILALIAGLVAGSAVNMGIIMISGLQLLTWLEHICQWLTLPGNWQQLNAS